MKIHLQLARLAKAVSMGILFFTANVPAQNSGGIAGQIKSERGAALANAYVSLEGTPRFSVTDANGAYKIEGVAAGNYTVVARIIGWKIGRQTATVATGQTSRADFTLVEEAVSLPDAQVVVTASRLGARAADHLPVSATVISAEKIKTAPANTPDELLRTIPGVQLPLENSNANFPANPSIALRGLGLGDGATRTLVLLDGVPMNGAFFQSVYWNRMPKQNIERIEVVRGGSSSLFGSYAMGGVVNVITRAMPQQSHLEFEAQGGSSSTYQFNGYGSTALSERVKVSLNANYFDTGGYFRVAPAQRGPIDRKPTAQSYSLQGKAEFELSEKSSGYLRGNIYSQDQDRDTRLNRTSTDVLDLAAGFQTQLGNAGALQANVFFADEEFTTDNISTVPDDTREGEFVSNAHVTPSTDIVGSVQWSNSLAHNRASITLGADARFINGKDDADIFLSDGTLFLNRIGKGKQRSLGIFGEVSYFPVAALEIAASLRQDFFRSSAGQDISNNVVTNFEAKDFNEFNPKLAIRFQAADQVGIKGSVYSAFRAPTLAELYRAFGTSSFVGLPNAQLGPEDLKGAEGGVEITAGRFFGQINGYYCEVENLVSGVVVGFNPFTLRNANIGKIRSQGLEFIGDLGVTEELLLSAGYTYLDAEVTENEDDPGLVGKKVEGTPENSFTFGLTYHRPAGVKFALRGRFIDDLFQDISNETALPSHSVFDASFSYPLGNQFEIFAFGENIFDKEYIASGFGGLNIFGAPRQVFAGIRLGFDPK